ncbi:MAG: hypothetical protein PHG06_00515 [Parabacteroides sp.]|nr:hypothetical protein [Parabacteroides sp.]
MTDDLESRVKAIEDQLTPDPDKISTMKASNRLKQYLDDHKIGNESQQDVIMRIVCRNEFLETRVKSLESEIEELLHELEIYVIECEGLKGTISGKELKTTHMEEKT